MLMDLKPLNSTLDVLILEATRVLPIVIVGLPAPLIETPSGISIIVLIVKLSFINTFE